MRKRLDKSNFWRKCITSIFLRVPITINVNPCCLLKFFSYSELYPEYRTLLRGKESLIQVI